MKKLYFEGAGMFGCRDTAEELRGNCRLRTMFHDVCRYHLPRTGAHGEIIPAEYLASKQ